MSWCCVNDGDWSAGLKRRMIYSALLNWKHQKVLIICRFWLSAAEMTVWCVVHYAAYLRLSIWIQECESNVVGGFSIWQIKIEHNMILNASFFTSVLQHLHQGGTVTLLKTWQLWQNSIIICVPFVLSFELHDITVFPLLNEMICKRCTTKKQIN